MIACGFFTFIHRGSYIPDSQQHLTNAFIKGITQAGFLLSYRPSYRCIIDMD